MNKHFWNLFLVFICLLLFLFFFNKFKFLICLDCWPFYTTLLCGYFLSRSLSVILSFFFRLLLFCYGYRRTKSTVNRLLRSIRIFGICFSVITFDSIIYIWIRSSNWHMFIYELIYIFYVRSNCFLRIYRSLCI